MPNYKNGKIYMIKCNKTNQVYYGSTTLPIKKRLQQHKYDTHSIIRTKKCKSNEIILGGDYCIELVEDYPCDTKRELNIRERYYIDNNECINMVIPTRTIKEYQQLEKYKINKKRYDTENQPKSNQSRRDRYKNDEEYRERCKARANKNYLKKELSI